jgi:hypothetical protein
MKNTEKNQTMLSYIESALSSAGVTVEFTSEISTVTVGRNRPPCIFFYAKNLSDAYKIHLATLLATDSGHAWKLTAFFPAGSGRLDAKQREPGELRFILEPIVKNPSLLHSVYELFQPYEFRREMADLSQALIEVSKPGWVPTADLTRRGFFTKHE